MEYQNFWAKTDSADPVGSWHPLVCHGLDVAACGWVVLEAHPSFRRRLVGLAGIDKEGLLPWLTFLLAIHDIGKAADSFQALVPSLFARQGRPNPQIPYRERHDLLGFLLWQEILLAPLVSDSQVFPSTAPSPNDREDWQDLLHPWILAVMGHHGVPPRSEGDQHALGALFPPPVREASLRMVQDLAALLLPEGIPFSLEGPGKLEARFRPISWPVAGLAVLADWLGSNRDFFPFATDLGMTVEESGLEAYWANHALPRAEEALSRSGLLPCSPAVAGGLQSLFGFDRPTPLQDLAQTLPLADGPQLLTIEEATGGGKTEAAVILAHRLMAEGRASGLYLALPTMATANAMYERIKRVFDRLFAPDASPSLVLAHGKRHLFLALETTHQEAPTSTTYGGAEPTGSQRCAAWLADSRKKALLAQVGVGTIDQALMAVLPFRHQSLRLAGLLGKVLVVDEVHAFDSYVSAVLERLLTFHAALGGSAILLSATLPRKLRRRLRTAFATGLGHGGYGRVEPAAAGSAYPALTQTAVNRQAVEAVAARPEASRRVRIQPLRTEDEVESYLAEALHRGGCACWIRNTVHDAQEAYDRLVKVYGRDRVTLFHSRFAVGDRARLEGDILARFGPRSGPEDRAGQLLIATQVVEQSLDLDFDRLATDLCPIDLALQRAGRLMRHLRKTDGTRLPNDTQQPDGRGEAILGLYGPAPEEGASETWYSAVFPRGAYVYPDHGQLWLTARWLESRGAFQVPEESRELIEFVYRDEATDSAPEALHKVSLQAEGQRDADDYTGSFNALPFDQGYQAGFHWYDEMLTPTRLGDPTITLRLVRQTPEGLEPWFVPAEDELRYHAWAFSEVSVRQALVQKEVDPDAPDLVALRATMPDRGKYSRLVVLSPSPTGDDVEGGRWNGTALNASGETVRILYSPRLGLTVRRSD